MREKYKCNKSLMYKNPRNNMLFYFTIGNTYDVSISDLTTYCGTSVAGRADIIDDYGKNIEQMNADTFNVYFEKVIN